MGHAEGGVRQENADLEVVDALSTPFYDQAHASSCASYAWFGLVGGGRVLGLRVGERDAICAHLGAPADAGRR
jgi:hypothetical protein